MEFPQTTDIQNIFGGGVFAAHQMMNNMDIARQVQQQKIADQEQITRARDIANQFSIQENPLKLRQSTANAYGTELNNVGREFENKGKARAERINSATESFQLDAEQKKLIQQSSDAEIKAMENLFQRMTYSANPEEQKKGLAGLQLSKEFLKIRETGNEARKTAAQQQEHSKSLENLRVGNARSLEEMRIGAGKYNRGSSATGVQTALSKVRNAAQAAEVLENAYFEAISNNDMQAAAVYQQRAQAARQRASEDASNRLAGAPGLGLGPNGTLENKPRPTADAPIAGANPQSNNVQRSPQDQQALQWANANPNDPRAKQIKQKLGVQ